MTRLDHNRALSQIAQKLDKSINDINQIIIWGNHSATQFPDLHHCLGDQRPVLELVSHEWYDLEFIPTVQQRGAAIISARGASSAASAANAAIGHMRDWALGSSIDDWVSMGVVSDGSYEISEGLIYSFPCICQNGEWIIVQDLEVNAFSRERMTISENELTEAMEAIAHLLKP